MLQDWLNFAMVCSQDNVIETQFITTTFEEEDLKNVVGSKLDDFSVIVSKISDGRNSKLRNEEITALKKKITNVFPCTAQYKHKLIQRFELIGIPLMCWNEDTIRSIGAELGEVLEIYFKDSNFSSVEILVKVEINAQHQQVPSSVTVVNGDREHKVLIREVIIPLKDKVIPYTLIMWNNSVLIR